MFGNPPKFTYVNKAEMFNDCWNVLNFKTACNVKYTSPMPLPHSRPASGLAVRDSLACGTKSNQLRCCCIQIISGSSVFDLLHLVFLFVFLFVPLRFFSHRIDIIIIKIMMGLRLHPKGCESTATPGSPLFYLARLTEEND